MQEDESSSFSFPLLLDASSAKVHVGVPSKDDWLFLERHDPPALTSLFKGVRKCLANLGSSLQAVDAILFCEGPGSTLGLRVALTLTKTLLGQISPAPAVFTYNALHAARSLTDNPSLPILVDYRQGQWYLQEPSGEIRIVEEEEASGLAASSQFLRQRKSWRQFPESGPDVKYDLSRLRGLRDLSKILHRAAKPTLFDLRPATFQKWKPLQDSENLAPEAP